MQSSAKKQHSTSHSFYQSKQCRVSQQSSNLILLPYQQNKRNIPRPSNSLNPIDSSSTQGPKILSKQMVSKRGELPLITPVFLEVKVTKKLENTGFSESKQEQCSKQSNYVSLSFNNITNAQHSSFGQRSTVRENSVEENSKSLYENSSQKKQSKLLQLLLNTDSQHQSVHTKQHLKMHQSELGSKYNESSHQYQYQKKSYKEVYQCLNRESINGKTTRISEKIRKNIVNNENIIELKLHNTDSDVISLTQKISSLQEQNKRLKDQLLDCQYDKIELNRKYAILEKKYVKLSNKLSIVDQLNLSSSSSLVINQERQKFSLKSSIKDLEIKEQLLTFEKDTASTNFKDQDEEQETLECKRQQEQNVVKTFSKATCHTEYSGQESNNEVTNRNNRSYYRNNFSQEGSKSQSQWKKYY